jgi:predicted lipoprotein with Yx(FWY)xxD motif
MLRIRNLPAGLALAALVAAPALAGGAVASAAQSHARQAVARSAPSDALDKTILVTRAGKTLYSLSAERGRRFICTDRSCLALWAPLVVKPGTVPTGAPSLATVKRPDGRTQVTYKGRPLYTFTQDRRPGDVRGNGFRDVGVWLAASPGTSRPATPPTPPAPAPPSPGPYG